jgi:quercetin dioxygenase-like cupin family protein
MFTKFLSRVAFTALTIFAALSIFAALNVFAHSADGLSTNDVTLVFDQTLPNVPGKSMKGVLVEYQPGGSSPAHTHPASSFIYVTVLKGAIRTQINDDPEKVYHKNFAERHGSHLASDSGGSANGKFICRQYYP